MKTETKRVPTNYAVSREQKRYVAKQNIKKLRNIPHSFKHDGYFSKHWREHVEVK